MLEVKIPSPPIAKIKAHINSNNLDTAKAIRGYMDTLTNSIKFIGKGDFSYTAGRVSDDGIFATIDVQQLPLYDKVAALFSNINFEQAMIAQIATGNKHYGQECPIANKNNLRQPIGTWSGRWVTIYLWTMLRADFSMRFLASPKQFVDNNLLMDALIERLGGAQAQAQTEAIKPTENEKAEPVATQEAKTDTNNQTPTEQAHEKPEPVDMLAVFEAQGEAENQAAEVKPEPTANTPTTAEAATKKPEKAQQIVNDGFDTATANKAAADCIDIEALYKLIRKSNNEAVELHCTAQSMDITEVVAARHAMSKETANAITTMVGKLLTTINNNPDFFEDTSRFKVEPEPVPKAVPIEEDDPLVQFYQDIEAVILARNTAFLVGVNEVYGGVVSKKTTDKIISKRVLGINKNPIRVV